MASQVNPIVPPTQVAIDIAEGGNLALVEHAHGRQQSFRFMLLRADYDRLVAFSAQTNPQPRQLRGRFVSHALMRLY